MDPHTEEVLEFGKIRAVFAQQATSELGRERIVQRPVASDAEAIGGEYAMAAELYRLFELDQRPPIDGLRDLRALWRRVLPRNAVLDPPQLIEIADFCAIVSRVRKFFAQKRAEAPRLAEQAESLVLLHDVEYNIRRAIEPNGEVADHASDRLRELRGQIHALEARIQHTLERLLHALDEADVLQDNFITQRQGRYVLPIKVGQKGKIRGIVHDASHSGETFFIEPFAVVEMTNELTELRVAAREEVRKILTALCDLVRAELDAFELDTALMAELDERVARARFGWEHRWILPQWHTGNRPLQLFGAHHPLLLLQSPETSVPLDIPLAAGDQALIISGPNAGGKTTALKTLGLLTLMFQSAMPLPADPASRFRVFDRVLADIGDEQDVVSGVSTFSSHIRHLAHILQLADQATLVLLDELGTATDPTEGGALAIAVVETLVEKGSLALVTSHMTLLKSWAEQHDHARNASFALDSKTRRPSYRLRLDVPGVSEALIIAEQQGLDRAVVERAYALLPEGVYDLNRILVRLQDRERELGEALAEAARREQAAEQLRAQLEAEREQMHEQRRHLKRDFLEEKQAWLRDVRRKIEEQIAHLPSREEILEAKRQVAAMQEDLAHEQSTLDRQAPFAPTAFDRLQPGMRVRVESLHDEGAIVAVDRERQRVTVAVRNVQVELTPDQVAAVGDQAGQTEAEGSIRVPPREYVPPELDLHGLRVEQALEQVDKYIDLALRHDLDQVRLRHGRGTGALRRAIHEFLRIHKSVRSFALADQEHGGDGVTVVQFK